jgi:predicted nucleic acid-binding protein
MSNKNQPVGHNIVIELRQSRKIKLPDAIIAATALCSGIELLSLDQHLLSVVRSAAKL